VTQPEILEPTILDSIEQIDRRRRIGFASLSGEQTSVHSAVKDCNLMPVGFVWQETGS
jgi:hypothetical protein